MYKAQSSYFRSTLSREFVHYIDDQLTFDDLWEQAEDQNTILESRRTNPMRKSPFVLALHDVPGIERASAISFSLPAVAAALRHNQYFREISLKDVSPLKYIILFVANILRHNVTVTSVHLENLEASKHFLVLGDMLRDNKKHVLQHLNLSGSKIPNSGILAIAVALESFQHRLRSLELRNCQLSGKRAVVLFSAFARHYGMSLGIEVLDVSGNRFDTEGSKAVEDWLWEAKEHSCLRELSLANSNLNMTAVSRSFRSLAHLQKLDISGNKVDKGAAQLLWVAIEESTSLTDLNVANCGLKAEQMQNILLVMLTNKNLSEIRVDMSYNQLTGKQVPDICAALRKGTNLHTFAFSGYKLKPEPFVLILKALARKPLLDTLILDKSYVGGESPEVSRGLGLLLKHTPALKALSVSGGYELVLSDFFVKLAKNSSLLELRVHDNRLRDEGVYALAEMLRENTSLMLVLYDRNSVSLDGWRSLRLAMEVNRTLLHLPFPWQDLEQVSEKVVEESRKVLSRVQELASTNSRVDTRRFVFLEEKNAGVHAPSGELLPLVAVPESLKELERMKKAEFVDYSYWLVNDLFDAKGEAGDEDLEGLLWIDAEGNVSDNMPEFSATQNTLYEPPSNAKQQFSFPPKPIPSPAAVRKGGASSLPPLPPRDGEQVAPASPAPALPFRESITGIAFPAKPMPAPPRP